MFQIVAVPFDAFQALPCAKSRWLLICFSRYVDKAGKAFPSLRQLARDAGISLASVSRYMTALERLGVFQRERSAGKRYHTTSWLRPTVRAGQDAPEGVFQPGDRVFQGLKRQNKQSLPSKQGTRTSALDSRNQD